MQGLKFGIAALLAASAMTPAWCETTVLKNLTLIDGVGAADFPAIGERGEVDTGRSQAHPIHFRRQSAPA